MSHVETRHPPPLKSNAFKNTISRTLFLLIVSAAATATYLVIKQRITPEKPKEFAQKRISDSYSRLERVDPEERDVFQGFRTSFLPPEEIVLAKEPRSKKDVYEGDVTSDILIWRGSERQRGTPTRVKRMSHFTFTAEQDTQDYGQNSVEGEKGDGDQLDEEYDSADGYDDEYEEYEDGDESAAHESRPPQHGVDRGPLDDVVEQVRGQPELEEGEMGTSAQHYKPVRSYTGIHAFWKGQGDKDTIRQTQADIMREYMDAEADPCQDFYQYACGNWAALNPIPADKAGYDTFEMLRENLDTVLRDLLEFKLDEKISSTYPGANLDLYENFLTNSKLPSKAKGNSAMKFLGKFDLPKFIASVTEKSIHKVNSSVEISIGTVKYDSDEINAEIVHRIRRYLDKKAKAIMKPVSSIGAKINKVVFQNNKRHSLKTKRAAQQMFKMHFLGSNIKTYDKMPFTKVSRINRIGRHLQMFEDSYKRKYKRDIESTLYAIEEKETRKKEDPSNGDAVLKAKFLFKSCMNYEILQKRGHQPLLDLLNLLGGWPILKADWNSTNFDWLELMAMLRLYNNDILISEWVGPDIKNSNEYVIQFDQTSLGLPTREYFLKESNKAYLAAYKEYLMKIALLLGGAHDHVVKSANDLIEFEIRLASITSAPDERRNVSELYRRMTLRKLEALVPQVRWRRYLCVVMNRTVHSDETVVLFALTYVRNLVKLINETEPSTLSNYLLWRFVRHRVNNLDDRFQSAKQQFYFILFGREQAPPRWKNCISQVNSNMGMALGSMFVKKYFDETSKNDTLTMTREIQQSFKELLHLTDWIDDWTKQLAALKVDAMMLRIGYPDFILNKNELDERYQEVMIHPDKYFENILNILQHLTKREQARLGQPVNKTLWNTAPAVVNAYYSRNKNQIMFPAGILQPPFYHRHFPRSLNYGGIGVVIGHEITHGFDDKGRLFDCDGNLFRWWSDSAIEAFHRRAQCLIDQYDRYIVPEVNMKLDGVNTQGENIADNGGVKQAFRAYQRWLAKHGSAGESLPGLNHTHTQLFFLNFAQVWCGAMRPEAMRNKLKTAVHAPGRCRVIGPLSNSHDFAREFRCPPGSPMNPTHKCSVW